MAHGLRYYKELTHADGKVVRLELLEKDYTGASMEIGPVCQALRLDIQGDTEIDAPIVKTSLSMTFVDAPDHVDAKTKKCGNWAEFYTNDATYWQVVVKAKNAGETAFRNVWGGYVTPDSYNEVLVYRGSVTIVARDNIGHLSDFPFDAVGNEDGMITLIELIREAWDKIESPMWLDDQAVANADWLMSEGAYAYDTYMNVSAFESKNWYDALESALYAYGLVMRYTGWNNVSFYALRNMPRMGAYEVDDIDYREPVFEAGAERELTPAVKRIEEAVEYKLTDSKSAPMAKSIKFTGATETIPFHSRDFFGDMKWTNIDVSPILNTTGEGWGNGTDHPPLFFNPLAYPCTQVVKDDAQSSIYLATNTDESGASWYAKLFKGKRFTFTIKFGRRIKKTTSVSECFSPFTTIKKVRLSIAASANGIAKYQNKDGEWQVEPIILDVPINEETREISKTVYLESFSKDLSLVLLTIHNITLGEKEGQDYDTWYDESEGGGIYVAVQSLTFAETHGDALCETNRVNTNYDATNNVILSREPKIAPALNDVLFPSIIKNGIFVKTGGTYQPARTWYWGGQTPQQMAVYNHLQLLCYHAKPNNILRGTIVNADVTDMQVIWMWHGAEHMFVSGSFNLLSGHIENAVLREFARYEDMWGILDEAHLPQVDVSSVTNVESGSASKNEGARNTINTEVYLGGGNIVLDDYMSDSSENGVMNRVIKAYIDNLWHLDENGNLVTDKQVIIKNNAIINADLSFVGNGEGGGGGLDESQLQDYLDLHKYITEDALSSYYTKAESDARYLASSLLGSNTLIHSGNIGSYAMKWMGNDGYRDLNTFSYDAGVFGSFYSPNAPSGVGAYAVLNLPYRRNAEKPDFMAQILIPNGDDADTNMYYRTSLADSWNPWRKVISTADDGYLYGLGGSIDIQYGDEINRYGGNLYLQHRGGSGATGSGTGGTTTGHILMCAYGGNVLIGTAVDSGYKLDVNGSISAMSALRIGGCGTEYCGLYPNSQITSNGQNSKLWLYNDYGLVLYGSSLEILTTTSISGNLIVSGDFSFGSDMRFKDKIEDMGISLADIANAPLFTFKWNDRDDDVIYLGSSAQYWEKIAPWLVSGDDFKSLNYATLGVAMGISLAKKTINHEERIKILEAEIKRLKREQYGS